MCTTICEIETGRIRGILLEDYGCRIFKGIPYAAAPVGELRWSAPKRAERWEETLDCTEFGSMFPQTIAQEGLYKKEFGIEGEEPNFSENSLLLNVWSPAEPREKCPVIVFIHGGAFRTGSSYDLPIDGKALCQRNIILVTIEYRLGIFGFFAHPELSGRSEHRVSGNYGLLDQIAALEWVKRNIVSFGGNPENITVMGSSAGACCIYDLMCSPLAEGLFQKAILCSGDGVTENSQELTLPEAEMLGIKLCEELQVSVAELMRMDAMELYEKTLTFLPMGTLPQGIRIKSLIFGNYVPVVDGYVLKKPSADCIREREYMDIPCMVGTVDKEFSDYMLQEDGNVKVECWIDGTRTFAALKASGQVEPVFVYQFRRTMPGDEEGAYHGAEMWYVFHTLRRCWRPFTAEDDLLADLVTDELAAFARYGSPNAQGLPEWKAYTKDTEFIMEWETPEDRKAREEAKKNN